MGEQLTAAGRMNDAGDKMISNGFANGNLSPGKKDGGAPFPAKDRCLDVSEKSKVSDFALCGGFGFKSGGSLKDYCQRVL